jgi:hypothetical protein
MLEGHLEQSGYLNGIREFAMARSVAPFFWSARMDGIR